MSERNNDRSGRWRNRTVAFRVSEEEARQLDMLVSISGLTKQDYITSKLLDRRVTVEPSSRIQRNLAGVMKEVLAELERADPSELTQELQEAIAMLARVFVGLGEGPPGTRSGPYSFSVAGRPRPGREAAFGRLRFGRALRRRRGAMKGPNSYFGDMVRTERLLREHGFDHWPTEDELVRYLFATNDRLDAVCNAMNAELVQDIRGNWQVVPKGRVMG